MVDNDLKFQKLMLRVLEKNGFEVTESIHQGRNGKGDKDESDNAFGLGC